MPRRQHTLGLQVRFGPVAVGQIVEAYRTASARRMYEPPFPNIDTGMTDLRTTPGGKEHQVTRLQGD